MTSSIQADGRRRPVVLLVCAGIAFLILLALGTWQVQRLHWKEALIASIDERIAAPPVPLAEIERLAGEGGDVDYRSAFAEGEYVHSAERHFFATHDGQSGWFVYTPLRLADGRYLFVNRGFVPFDRKDPATRAEGQVAGSVAVEGLARSALAEKPSAVLPDNEPDKNQFYWKDLTTMIASAGLPDGAEVLPFFVDAGPSPNPDGLPVGGVTIVSLPNNHLQYAVTWYGLAAVLVAVTVVYLRRPRGRP